MIIRHLLALVLSVCFFPTAQATTDDGTIWIYGSHFSRPNPNLELIEYTRAALESALHRPVRYREMEEYELRKALSENIPALAVAVAGTAQEQLHNNINAVATMCAPDSSDPDHAVGALVVTRNDRTDINRLEDLKGLKVSSNFPWGFTTTLTVLREFARFDRDPDSFADMIYTGWDHIDRLLRLRRGEADAAVIPSCLLERYRAEGKEILQGLKTVGAKRTASACLASTALYPSYTLLLNTKKFSGNEVKTIYRTVYSMPFYEGLGWGVTTDFSAVEDVYKTLRRGVYAPKPWTWKYLFHKYWQLMLMCLVVLVSWGLFTIRTTHLVKKRTAQLSASLEKEKRLSLEFARLNDRFGKAQKALVISLMSGMVAHELAQPIAGILLYVQSIGLFLKKSVGLDNKTKNRMETAVAEIEACASRAREIVQNVRSYSKAQQRETQPIWLKDLLQRVVARFIKYYGVREEAVTFNVFCDNVLVSGNELELELAFTNILKNSLDAAVSKDDLKIRIESFVGGSETITIEIADNGRRVDDETLLRMNEPLNSTKSKGLGLGLSIVRSIIEAHGGKLILTRVKPQGLLARFILPIASET